MEKTQAMFGAGVLAPSLLLSGVTGYAADDKIAPAKRHELRHDRGEIRGDKVEIVQESNELGNDRRELRQDRREYRRDLKDAVRN